MKVLVTGSTGLLGHQVVRLALASGHDVVSSYIGRPPTEGTPVELDLLDSQLVRSTMSELRPDCIIHTAAFTDVDGCEVNREVAHNVNAGAAEQVALAAEDVGAHLIHVSTDYVFDGEKGMYKEDDPAHPISYYGLTKLEGERHVQESSKRWCIARASAIYGWGGEKKNFATWLLDNFSAGKQVNAAADQYVSPTFNTNLAGMLLEVAEKRMTGFLHTAGATRMNRYDFAVELAAVFGHSPGLVRQVKMSEINWIAKRPRDSSLDVSRCMGFATKPLGVPEALRVMKGQR